MANSVSLCILDNDPQYIKTFMSVVAEGYSGYTVSAKTSCEGDCEDLMDACIHFGQLFGEKNAYCSKAFKPECGRYAGVREILHGVKTFLLGKSPEQGRVRIPKVSETNTLWGAGGSRPKFEPFSSGTLLCFHAFAGGVGTSLSAIGAGRELSRYRGEQVLYLSLEDIENLSLYPAHLSAMRVEETLYRYFRVQSEGSARNELNKLFSAAAVCDEYGLYRLAPDEGICVLAGLVPGDLYAFLHSIAEALELTRIVLDFGTRIHFLSSFATLLEDDEAIFINVIQADEDSSNRATERSIPGIREARKIAFSRCEGSFDFVGTFGREIKVLCDQILGCDMTEMPEKAIGISL